MLLGTVSQKMFCAIPAAAVAMAGVAACGKDEPKGSAASGGAATSSAAPGGSEGGATVTYEVTSNVAKPFKVSYIAQTSAGSPAELAKTLSTDTGTSTWKKEVFLSKGVDYAFVIVTVDPSNFDSSTKFSCEITSGGKTIDAKKDQSAVAGCAGLKLRDKLEKAGS
ncbi:hypothetical protein Srot_2258 [Segniliparus rotundus DSM 44985]|uniref:Lipoprotein n=1 Tax=Segniliparus rotundus (strain ATCC BAA-972 / CDC 1076 / CIP 108378 / DSM 44985 / JCM 13578) TaxID=640132 RepID=D6ZA38_SEGRD|nr:hypothetical protein [Segniliparus rotundus]ADG98708.1 hypothetical protein Srot_2258 [Segniliparus rotundus DSM 44985]